MTKKAGIAQKRKTLEEAMNTGVVRGEAVSVAESSVKAATRAVRANIDRGDRSDREFMSADSEGLSRRASADSESVAELLEEGNAFEAAAVSGVEAADNCEGRPVEARELMENDVPDEYLEQQA